MDMKEAFDKLFVVAADALDSDVDMSEERRNEVMNELWSVLREVKGFYSGDMPDWLNYERTTQDR